MAIGKKTGGRKLGSNNKAKKELVAAILASGETPLQYMVRVMRDTGVEHERRDRMAAAAAPYVHAKLQTVEHGGKDGGPIVVNVMKFSDG